MNKEALIEKYFNNKLTKAEFRQLEKLLKNDQQLKAQFYKELEIKQFIAQEKNSVLKSRFQELERNSQRKPKWIPFAAALALIMGLFSFIYNFLKNDQDLYAENFEVYPNVISPITRSESSQENTETIAFEHYDKGNYDEAIKAFDLAYERIPKDYLLFYKAVSFLAHGQIEEGIRVFKSYGWEQHNSDFSSAANWYLGLAYIEQQQFDLAEIHLRKVVNSESVLSKQAQKLLGSLD